MGDLEICKGILEKKHRRVLSSVRVVVGGIHWEGAAAECWSPDNTGTGAFEIRINPLYEPTPVTLMHELVHVSQLEHGIKWGSGQYAVATAPALDDPAYDAWVRSYYQTFAPEHQAELLAQQLAGTKSSLQWAMRYLRKS